ncbi:hypothetical protein TWF788_007480 [Orbilia oligospora]|uniref:Nephrocystin 3-like N-terminal domain-containing protein n=1 Tax=Orbilia oligospora TaxID=2813651 RepID=A0A7C8PSV5_ORBOL|nr:hypothetical protein TWF788_007480 [Orbilia oligospora]
MATKKNRGTYRARGIDINTTEDEFTTALEGQLTNDEKGRYKFDTRLAPCCIEPQSYQIATFRVASTPFVTSGAETAVPPLASETPSFLEREKPSLDLRGITIQIDPDFYGLTQLYHVPEDKIKIDIVALSGLNSHAYGSWIGPQTGDRKPMWLQDFLSQDKQLKYCRTMVFGYDTKYDSKAQFWIEDYVNILLTELNKARRREEERKRPLVLMGHSFGGTVLTHAYVTASEDEKYKDLYDSITNIFFFGVPFAGIELDDVRSMLEDNEELSGQCRWIDGQGHELVNYIDYETARLTKTTRTFMKKIPENRTYIHSFYETYKTPEVIKLESGDFARRGTPKIIVQERSVELGILDFEETMAAEADHSTIVKLSSPQDKTYTTVRDRLIETLQRLESPAHVEWPLVSSEAAKIARNLKTCNKNITHALAIDQSIQIQKVSRKLDFGALPTAEGAEYGSFKDQHEPKCLPNTRVQLLKDIENWVEDPQGHCIFWLNGVAGTGKSTISRTVAKKLKYKDLLASSFFFRRGEKDRGDASKFFTTLATQLANYINDISPSIQNVIEQYPQIASMNHKEQFNQLILKPLSELADVSQLSQQSSFPTKAVLVIDALDECDREQDQELIVSLLAKLEEIKSIKIYVFLTSRPELPLRISFEKLPGNMHRDMILHKIPGIQEDITTFLEFEFAKIRDLYFLPLEWPGDEQIGKLAAMAVPLFIFAATACRFIADTDPEEQIEIVMSYQSNWHTSQLEATYLPILHRLKQKAISYQTLIKDFRQIVGTIINLASPISIPSLSNLLAISERKVSSRLWQLHSVLEVPKPSSGSATQTNINAPVRMLHLSFRDFLSGESLRDNVEFRDFWIDEKEAHRNIYRKCIELMSKHLKKDICNLRVPGIFRFDIDESLIMKHLPTEIQYSCRYWVYHLERSRDKVKDGGIVDVFLRQHFLHWLEAVSFSGEIYEMVYIIDALKATAVGENISALVYDIQRFVRQNQTIINRAPLQVYWSALLFAPKKSVLRSIFDPRDIIPEVELTRSSIVQEQWSAVLQTLEGHTDSVGSLAFSANGGFLASGSWDCTIRIWDVATGAPLHIFRGHKGWINDVTFYTIGVDEFVASASDDRTVKLWSVATGTLVRTLVYGNRVKALASTKHGNTVVLASASHDKQVRIWDVTDGALVRVLEGHESHVNTVAFSGDGKMLASGSSDRTARIWDAITGVSLHELKFNDSVNRVLFSANTNVLAILVWGGIVGIADAVTGSLLWRVSLGMVKNVGMAFSTDERKLVLASNKGGIQGLDVATGAVIEEYEEGTPNYGSPTSVTLSKNEKILASAENGRLRIMEMRIGRSLSGSQKSGIRTAGFRGLAISDDGKTLVSVSRGVEVSMWDLATGDLRRTIKMDEKGSSWNIAVSSDGELVALDLHTSSSGDGDGDGDRYSIVVWNTTTGDRLQRLQAGAESTKCLLFSPNDEMIASSWGRKIRIWNTSTWKLLHVFQRHTAEVNQIAFAPDSKTLASASHDRTVRVWDPATGILLQTLNSHSGLGGVAFSGDGKLLASASFDSTIQVWDVATWAPQQKFSTKFLPGQISFSKDDRYIITRGTDVTHYKRTTAPLSPLFFQPPTINHQPPPSQPPTSKLPNLQTPKLQNSKSNGLPQRPNHWRAHWLCHVRQALRSPRVAYTKPPAPRGHRIMEEEGHGICEAVIRGVKLFGVTDPQTIEKIRSAGSPTTTNNNNISTIGTTATRAPITTRASVKPIAGASNKPVVPAARPITAVSAPPAYLLAPLARLRGGAKPRPHERWMLKYLEGEGEGEGGEEKKKKEKKEETGGEEVLGLGKAEPLVAKAVERPYVPPHLRHKLPARSLARDSSSQ